MLARARLAVVFACTLGACFADPLHDSDSLEWAESDRVVIRVHDARTERPPARANADAGEPDAAESDAGSAGVRVPEQSPPEQPLADPRILIRDVVNARDLGGTPLAHGTAVARGVLFRGPPLSDFLEQGCNDFAELGIHTLVDLRTADERDGTPDARCVTQSTQLVLAPLPVPYNVSPTDYIADLNTTESIAKVFHALGDDAAYPLYFHCTYGRDRTGVLAALILLALGASRDAILREYLISQPSVGAYPDSLDAVLQEIDRRGGIAAYLASAAISPNEVATLRAHAIAH